MARKKAKPAKKLSPETRAELRAIDAEFKERVNAIRAGLPADTPRRIMHRHGPENAAAAFLTRWANLTGLLDTVRNEAWKVWHLAKAAEEYGIGPFLEIDVAEVHKFASELHAAGRQVVPFMGSTELIRSASEHEARRRESRPKQVAAAAT